MASASAGRSGVSSFRFGEVTPMPRSVPPCICGIATEKSAKARSITPEITSVTASGTPRYDAEVIVMPPRLCSCAFDICDAPEP